MNDVFTLIHRFGSVSFVILASACSPGLIFDPMTAGTGGASTGIGGGLEASGGGVVAAGGGIEGTGGGSATGGGMEGIGGGSAAGGGVEGTGGGSATGGGVEGTGGGSATGGGFNGTGGGTVVPVVPDRVVFVFSPHGTPPAQWQASTNGGNLELGGTLAPLQPYRDSVNVLRGLNLPDPYAAGLVYPAQSYSFGPAVILTGLVGPIQILQSGVNGGFDWQYFSAGGPSLDRVLGQRLASKVTPFFGIGTVPYAFYPPQVISWGGPNQFIGPTLDPRDAFSTLYANSSNATHADVVALAAFVNSRSDWGTPATFSETTRAHFRVLHSALANDEARVATIQIGQAFCYVALTWLGYPQELFHEAAHSGIPGGGSAQAYEALQLWVASEVAAFIGQLKATATPDGKTLLDHTLVVWMSETGGEPALHGERDIPVITVGNVSGRVRTGQLLTFQNRPHSDFLLTVGQLLDPTLTNFGPMSASPMMSLKAP